jgi:hypothetical protein
MLFFELGGSCSSYYGKSAAGRNAHAKPSSIGVGPRRASIRIAACNRGLILREYAPTTRYLQLKVSTIKDLEDEHVVVIVTHKATESSRIT